MEGSEREREGGSEGGREQRPSKEGIRNVANVRVDHKLRTARKAPGREGGREGGREEGLSSTHTHAHKKEGREGGREGGNNVPPRKESKISPM